MTVTDPAFDADLPKVVLALGAVAGPDPQVVGAARSALAARIAATPHRRRDSAGSPLGTDRSDHPKRRPVAIVTAAAFATAAAVSAPFVLSSLTNHQSGAPATRVATSTPVASTPVASTPTTPVVDGRHAAWWYSKSIYRNTPKEAPTVRQIWQSPTTAGLLIDHGVSPKPILLTNEDAKGPNADRSVFGVIGKHSQLVYWPTLWQLPTDPIKLATLLREGSAGAGNGPDAELFVVVGDMLRESPAPEALRKALYRVALADPGVRDVGPVTDSQGRPGVAVERDTGGSVQRYTFDPHDFRLLEERDSAWSMTYLVAGPVESDHDVPSS
jgi:hypothetical protein